MEIGIKVGGIGVGVEEWVEDVWQQVYGTYFLESLSMTRATPGITASITLLEKSCVILITLMRKM